MKHSIMFAMALVLSGGFFAGCSNEVHNPHQEQACPTDGLASWGQDVYYGRYIPCFSDGHSVPFTLPHHHEYYNDSMTASASVDTMTGSTSVNTMAGSGSMNTMAGSAAVNTMGGSTSVNTTATAPDNATHGQ